MYSKKTSLLIGFHGCDESTRDEVINGGNLNPSLNSYDWLGNGIYFWEADPQRALEWAEQLHEKPPEGGFSPSMADLCPRFILVLCLEIYQHMKHGVGNESCEY